MKSEEHSGVYIIDILFEFASHHSLKPGTMEAKGEGGISNSWA